MGKCFRRIKEGFKSNLGVVWKGRRFKMSIWSRMEIIIKIIWCLDVGSKSIWIRRIMTVCLVRKGFIIMI